MDSGALQGMCLPDLDKDDYGYMVRPRINCNYSAVTAACMMVDRKAFEEVRRIQRRIQGRIK